MGNTDTQTCTEKCNFTFPTTASETGCRNCEAGNDRNQCSTCLDDNAVVKADKLGCECNSDSFYQTFSQTCVNKCTTRFQTTLLDTGCDTCETGDREHLCASCTDVNAKLRPDQLGCICMDDFTFD